MKVVKDALDAILREDGVLTEIMGIDSLGNHKIYDGPDFRPANDSPPFVVYQIIPGRRPVGNFGDNESMPAIDIQITAWGRTSEEVWLIDSLVYSALRDGDWNTRLMPWNLMMMSRLTSPGEMPDLETKWRQVPTTWRVDLSR